MGIKKLSSIIQKYAENSVTIKSMSHYRGTVQAIDASLILHKYFFVNNDSKNCHIETCFSKTMLMLKYGIMPYWIFDGCPPPIKQMTIDKRKAIKENAREKLNDPNVVNKKKYIRLALSISKKDIKDVKYLLFLLGLEYKESVSEADIECGILSRATIVNGVVSEDSDMLLFGCEKLLKNFFNKANIIEIDVEILLKELDMNLEQLIDMCAILGNDYCLGIKNMYPLDVYQRFKKCNCNMRVFLELIKYDKNYVIPDNFVSTWLASKEYYLSTYTNRKYEKIFWKEPDYLLLYIFLVVEKGFDRNKVIGKLEEIRKMYRYYYSHDCNLGPYNIIRRIKHI
jgi:flap endonuclease-1